MKGELPEGADRLAVAVRERGVGSLRGEAANSPEGGAGSARKELRPAAGRPPAGNRNRKSGSPGRRDAVRSPRAGGGPLGVL